MPQLGTKALDRETHKMANIVAYVNLYQLLLLITILTCLERAFVHTATEEDFPGKIHLENGKDLVPGWTWSVTKQKKLEPEQYFDIIRRTLGVISAIFTIWIFTETRNKYYEEQTTNELLEELSLQVENLNFRLEEVKKSLLHMSCLYDAVQVQTKSKVVSKDCLQSIQQHRKTVTYDPLLTKTPHRPSSRQIKKKSFSLILIRLLGSNK